MRFHLCWRIRSTGCLWSTPWQGTPFTFSPTREFSSSWSFLWVTVAWQPLKILPLQLGSCAITDYQLHSFLCGQISEMPKPSFLRQSIGELNIGTFQNIAVVRADTPLYTALRIFVEQRVSALPVVDDKGVQLIRLLSEWICCVFVLTLPLCCRPGGGHLFQIWRDRKFFAMKFGSRGLRCQNL